MPAIIKAADSHRDVQAVAFNFDDMTEKAKGCLAKVRAEAEGILRKAHQDAQTIRAEAVQAGRREGRGEVEKIVRDQLAGQMATLLPALQKAVLDIHNAKQAWLTHWEKNAVHLAAQIAQRVIRREIEKTPEITIALVREALELASGSSHVRVLLNPKDLESLGPQIDALVAELSSLGSIELAAEDSVSPGGCRVETRFGTIDQQFEAQLARIEEELT